VLGSIEGSGGNAGQISAGGATSAHGGQGHGGQSSGGWTDATCYEAVAHGHNGDPCQGAFSCKGATINCCRLQATCVNNVLALDELCDACPCPNDLSCRYGMWCIEGFCQPCPWPTPHCDQTLFPRNGCQWCVPPQGCPTPPFACGPDQMCYAGQACSPLCMRPDDPNCCFGNLCAAPGCGSTAGLDCSIFGCPDGSVCDVVSRDQFCRCEAGRWVCSGASPNKCVPL
jgi:hypothetical protein